MVSRSIVKITPRLISSDSWVVSGWGVSHFSWFIDRVSGVYTTSGDSESKSGEKSTAPRTIGSCRRVRGDVDLKDEAGIISVSCKIHDDGRNGESHAADYDIALTSTK